MNCSSHSQGKLIWEDGYVGTTGKKVNGVSRYF